MVGGKNSNEKQWLWAVFRLLRWRRRS